MTYGFLGWRTLMLRGVVCLVAVTAGACATHGSAAAQSAELERYMAAVRRQTNDLKPPPEPANKAATLEATDGAIKAALLEVTVAPSALSHRRLAEAYARRGVLDAAYDEFSAALALAPRDGAAFDGRARVWRDWGLPNLGLNDIHRALYYAPDSPVPYNTLGTLLLNLGFTHDARHAFEQALGKDPSAAYALGNLCYADVLAGDGPAAIAACERARAAQPGLALSRTNLALAHAVAGDLPTALRIIAHPGRASLAAYDLGLALMDIGRYPAAAAAFDEAVANRPGFAQAVARAKLARRLADSPGVGSRR